MRWSWRPSKGLSDIEKFFILLRIKIPACAGMTGVIIWQLHLCHRSGRSRILPRLVIADMEGTG